MEEPRLHLLLRLVLPPRPGCASRSALIQAAIVFVLLFAGCAHHGRLLSLTRPQARP